MLHFLVTTKPLYIGFSVDGCFLLQFFRAENVLVQVGQVVQETRSEPQNLQYAVHEARVP